MLTVWGIYVRNPYSGIFHSFDSVIYLVGLCYIPVHVRNHFKNEEHWKNDTAYHLVGLSWIRQRNQKIKILKLRTYRGHLAYFRVAKEGLCGNQIFSRLTYKR